MSSSKFTDDLPSDGSSSVVREEHIEYGFIGTLQKLKHEYRPDITDRATLEANFREKFESLNRVHLTNAEFARLLDEIVTPDVFTASKTLRAISSFTRDDGTPLNYTLVNIKDWCKNTFEVVRHPDCAGEAQLVSQRIGPTSLAWSAGEEREVKTAMRISPLRFAPAR